MTENKIHKKGIKSKLFVCAVTIAFVASIVTFGFVSANNGAYALKANAGVLSAGQPSASILNLDNNGTEQNNFQSKITGGQKYAIYFGTFNNTPILWRVLSTNDTKYGTGNEWLMWADKSVTGHKYNDISGNPNYGFWSDSQIRAKLNGGTYVNGSVPNNQSFFETWFSQEEREKIGTINGYVTKDWAGQPSTSFNTTNITDPSSNNCKYSESTLDSKTNIQFTSKRGQVIERVDGGKDHLILLDYADIVNAAYGFTNNGGQTYVTKAGKSWDSNTDPYWGYNDINNNPALANANDIVGLFDKELRYFWLRPAGHYINDSFGLCGFINGGVTGDYVYGEDGVRPAFNFNPNNIIYGTAAKNAEGTLSPADEIDWEGHKSFEPNRDIPAYKVYSKSQGYKFYGGSDIKIMADSGKLTVTAPNESGSAVFLLKDKNDNSGNVKYQAVANMSGGSASVNIGAINVDNYALTVLFTDGQAKGGNFAEYVKASYTTNAIPKKVSPIVNKKPTVTNSSYTGEEIALISADGSVTGGTLSYAIGTSNQQAPSDFDFTYDNGNLPKKKDCGTYHIWYKVTGDDSHTNIQPTYLGAANITQKPLNITFKSDSWDIEKGKPKTINISHDGYAADDLKLSLSYNGKSSGKINLSGGGNKYTADIPVNLDMGSYNLIITVEGSSKGNYIIGEYKQLFSVSAIKIAKPTISPSTQPYTSKDVSFTLNFDETNVQAIPKNGGQIIGKVFKASSAGKYEIEFKLIKTDTCVWADGTSIPITLTAEITKKEINITFGKKGEWSWNNAIKQDVYFDVTGIEGNDNLTFDFSYAKDSGGNSNSLPLSQQGTRYSATIPANLQNGTYNISVKLSSDIVNNNYTIKGETSKKFEITNKKSKFTESNLQWKYTHGIDTVNAIPGFSLPYDGKEVKVFADDANLADLGIRIVGYTGTQTATNASPYTTTVNIAALDGWDYDGIKTFTISWTIEKAKYDLSNAKWVYKGNGLSGQEYTKPLEYFTGFYEVELQGLPDGLTASYVDNRKTDVGKYIANITMWNNNNNENYEKPDRGNKNTYIGSYPQPLSWEIIKGKIKINWSTKRHNDKNSGVFDLPYITQGEDKIDYVYYKSTSFGDKLGGVVQLDDIVVGNIVEFFVAEVKLKSNLVDMYILDGNPEQPFTIGKDKVKVTITGITGSGEKYDGQPKKAGLQISGSLTESDFIVTYYKGSVAVEGTPINAGQYTVTVTLVPEKLADFYIDGNNTFTFEIKKQQLDMTGVKWNYDSSKPFVYDRTGGTEKVYTVKLDKLPKYLEDKVTYQDNSGTTGKHTAHYAITIPEKDKNNYEIINNSVPETLSWEIAKKQFDKPAYTGGDIIFDDTEHDIAKLVNLPNGYEDYMKLDIKKNQTPISGNSAKGVGQYTIKISFITTIINNVEWKDDNSSTPYQIDVKIVPLEITVTGWSGNPPSPTFDVPVANKFYELKYMDGGVEFKISEIDKHEGKTLKVEIKVPTNMTGNVNISGSPLDKEFIYFAAPAEELPRPTISTPSGEFNDNPHDVMSFISGYDGTKMDIKITGDNFKPINVGNYKIVITIKSTVNGKWGTEGPKDVTLNYEITKKKIDKPTADLTEFTYNGSPQIYNPVGFDGTRMTISGNEQTNANSYTVTVSLLDKDNTCWNDESADDVTFTWVLAKLKIDKPTADLTEFTYNGSSQTYNPAGFDSATMLIKDNKQTNANSYTVTVSLLDKVNTCWADGSVTDVEFVWKIAKQTIAEKWSTDMPPVLNGAYDSILDYVYTDNGGAVIAKEDFKDGETYYAQAKIKPEFTGNYGFGASGNAESEKQPFTTKPLTPMDIPTVEGTFTYNGQEQTFVLVGNDLDKIDVVGQLTYKNAGEYSVTVKIKPEFASEYKWNDNTTGEKTLKFSIAKMKIDKPTENNGEFIYNGKEQEFALDGFDGKYMKVTGNKQTNAKDDYKVTVSLLDKVNTCWTDDEEGKDVTFDFVIEKLVLPAPTASEQLFTYNGKVQEYMPEGFNKEFMTIKDNKRTNAGTDTVTVSLKDKNNVVWEEAGVTEYTFSFEIKRLDIKPKWKNDENGIPKLVNPDIPESEIEYIFKDKDGNECGEDELLLDEQYSVQASFKNGNINNCVFTDTGKTITNKHMFKFNGGLEPSTPSDSTSGGLPEGFPLWQIIVLALSIIGVITFSVLTASYADKKKKMSEQNDYYINATLLLPILGTALYLGLSTGAWTIIAVCALVLAIIMFVVMMVVRGGYKAVEKENREKRVQEEKKRREEKEMESKMMLAAMMGGRGSMFNGGTQQGNGTIYGGENTDISGIATKVYEKILPIMQSLLPDKSGDESLKKVLDEQNKIIAQKNKELNDMADEFKKFKEDREMSAVAKERYENEIKERERMEQEKKMNDMRDYQMREYQRQKDKNIADDKIISMLENQNKKLDEQSAKIEEQARVIKKLREMSENAEAQAKMNAKSDNDSAMREANAVKMAKIAMLIDDAIAKNASKQTYMEMANMLIEAATNAKGDLDKVQLNSCVNKLIERIKSTK